MKINKLNYEVYIIDYIEGQLNGEDKIAFDLFLKSHPEVRSEISEFLEAPRLEEDTTISFADKAQLTRDNKKPIWLIAALSLFLIISLTTWIISSSADAAIEQKSSVLQNSKPQETASETPYQPIAENTVTKQKETSNSELVAQISTVKKNTKVVASTTTQLKTTKTKTKAERKITSAPNGYANQSSAQLPGASKTANIPVRKPRNKPAPVATFEALPTMGIASVASIHQQKTIADEIVDIIYITTANTNNKWWSVLKPKAYDNIKLGEALSSLTLESAVQELELTLLP